MLHSFWYEKASDAFAAIAQKDPTCGMAYWGIAMTYYHQVWQAPDPADLGVCREYVRTSLTLRWRYIEQRQNRKRETGVT
jgi:hypothetical protein